MVSVKVIKYHVNASVILYRSRKLQQTTQTCCKLWILPACRKMSSSCSESVDFIKLQQVCENQTCCNLIFADLLHAVETTASSLWIKSLDNQLPASLLTTCSRLVIIKPEQAMRTHPDIGLMTARQQACSRLAATFAFLAVQSILSSCRENLLACYNLSFADLLQLVETTCSKLVVKTF